MLTVHNLSHAPPLRGPLEHSLVLGTEVMLCFHSTVALILPSLFPGCLWSIYDHLLAPMLVLGDLCITSFINVYKNHELQALHPEKKLRSSEKYIHLIKVTQPRGRARSWLQPPCLFLLDTPPNPLPHMELNPMENLPEIPSGAQGLLKFGSNIQESFETSWRDQRRGCPTSAGWPYPCGLFASRAFFSFLPAIQMTVSVSQT